MTADLAGGSQGFNLRLAVLGLAGGAGATLSTTVAGRIAQDFGLPTTLLALATTRAAAVAGVLLLLGETQPVRHENDARRLSAAEAPGLPSWGP